MCVYVWTRFHKNCKFYVLEEGADSAETVANENFHAVLLQLFMQHHRHFLVERSHDLRKSLDETNLHASALKLLSHFNTDETCTTYSGALALHLHRRIKFTTSSLPEIGDVDIE